MLVENFLDMMMARVYNRRASNYIIEYFMSPEIVGVIKLRESFWSWKSTTVTLSIDLRLVES